MRGPKPYKVVYTLRGYPGEHYSRTVKSYPTYEGAVKEARDLVTAWKTHDYFWRVDRVQIWYGCPPKPWQKNVYPYRCYRQDDRPCTPNTPYLMITFTSKTIEAPGVPGGSSEIKTSQERRRRTIRKYSKKGLRPHNANFAS